MIEIFREFKNLCESILVHKKLKTKPGILLLYKLICNLCLHMRMINCSDVIDISLSY